MVKGSTGTGSHFFGPAAQTARLMLYSLIAVVLMAMDQRGHYVPRVRGAAEYLVEPVYHLIEWPIRASRNLFTQFQSRRTLRRENESLREQLLSQQAALQRLDTLEEENGRLRSLFEGAEGQEFGYRYAELVKVELDPFSHKVLIDRGSADGVIKGQAVIDGAGVMGQVEEVHLHFSNVRLISDPNHALPVQINRTGLRTVAFGSGETGQLNMPSVPMQADVRQGDLVVTSGLGDRFPGGYPVARVSIITREEGQTFAQVQAEPLAALDRGREVLLISSPKSGPAPEIPGDDQSESVDGDGDGAAAGTQDDEADTAPEAAGGEQE